MEGRPLANQRLINDSAEGMSRVLLDLVKHLLREEEWRDAQYEFFLTCMKGLESYEIHRRHLIARLNPTKN
jgi:hypothetical protein